MAYPGGQVRRIRISLLISLLVLATRVGASIFGSVSGLIHDPQHRPVQGVRVVLRGETSEWSKLASSNESGEFRFDAVPLGSYTVTMELAGFTAQEQKLTL